jgi:uncharacterized protein
MFKNDNRTTEFGLDRQADFEVGKNGKFNLKQNVNILNRQGAKEVTTLTKAYKAANGQMQDYDKAIARHVVTMKK